MGPGKAAMSLGLKIGFSVARKDRSRPLARPVIKIDAYMGQLVALALVISALETILLWQAFVLFPCGSSGPFCRVHGKDFSITF